MKVKNLHTLFNRPSTINTIKQNLQKSFTAQMTAQAAPLSVMKAHLKDEVTLDGILKARERIKDHVYLTPVVTCSYFDQLLGDGKKLYFKCENFQKTGSFKIRGALNSVSRIIEERGNTDFHTLTHSSGNAGQAIALASSMKGVQAKVVMPLNAPVSKKNATEGYGAEIFRCENSSEARSKMTQEIADKNPDKAEYIPSADHPFMMEGQGTITLEMLEQQPDLDALVIACSVGGMIAGMAKACKLVKPNVKVFAVEPDRADDLAQSFKTGKQVKLSAYPDTIADGLRMSVGDQTWPVIRETVEPDVLLVTEEEIKKSMYLIFERMKLVVEPSAAVVLAAVLTDQFRSLSDGLNNIGLVLCGGNPDLKSLPW